VELTVFFDGFCPLCVREMDQLRARDRHGLLRLVDIHAENFSVEYPDINKDAANKVLHAQQTNGAMLYGLDANCKAWELVGSRRLKFLRWPGVRFIADFGYWMFARYRYKISYLLTGQKRCERCINSFDNQDARSAQEVKVSTRSQ